MNGAGLLDRKELAKAVGVNPVTFWKKVLDFNDFALRNGKDGIKPDFIEDNGRYRKFFFKPERAEEIKKALGPIGSRGRPKPANSNEGTHPS